MHARSRIFLGILTAGLAMTTAAWAAKNGYHGSLCNPVTHDDAEGLRYDKLGVSNTSDSWAVVVCGALPAVSSNVTKVEAFVDDKDPANDVCCRVSVQKLDGTPIASVKKCSAGFGDSPQTLSYSLPANSVGTMNIVCSIPPNHANGTSHVISYSVETN